jgi:hypothetical protein
LTHGPSNCGASLASLRRSGCLRSDPDIAVAPSKGRRLLPAPRPQENSLVP